MGSFDFFKNYIYCPICYEKIDLKNDVEYACSCRGHEEEQIKGNKYTVLKKNIVPNCPKCLKERYPKTFESWKPENPPEKRGRVDSIRCPYCKKIFPYQLALYKKTYRISIIGSPKSGKTIFLSRLKYEVRDNEILSVSNKFPGKGFENLTEDDKLPEKTDETTGNEVRETYYLGVSIEGKGDILLIIYDFGGEDFQHLNPNLKNALVNSDAVFVTIDVKDNISVDGAIERVADVKNIINGESSKKVKFAYIFTKADAKLENDLKVLNKKNIELNKPTNQLIWLDEACTEPNYTKYNEDLDNFPDSEGIAKSLFKDQYRFLFSEFQNKDGYKIKPKSFIVSALGFGSVVKIDEGQAYLIKKGKAFRVLDPLWWVLFGR